MHSRFKLIDNTAGVSSYQSLSPPSPSTQPCPSPTPTMMSRVSLTKYQLGAPMPSYDRSSLSIPLQPSSSHLLTPSPECMSSSSSHTTRLSPSSPCSPHLPPLSSHTSPNILPSVARSLKNINP